jgi:hypothetical protein
MKEKANFAQNNEERVNKRYAKIIRRRRKAMLDLKTVNIKMKKKC